LNPEVQESTRIIKTINRHLDEPCCNHSLETILLEALSNEDNYINDKGGIRPTTGEHQVSKSINTKGIDIDSKYCSSK
jgi:hypothetical protein